MTKTENFINKADSVHSGNYQYNDTNYVNSKTKVKIFCSTHGTFEMSPNNHLSGQGCPRCSKRHKLTTEDFISRATKLHGSTFDYSLSVYKSMKTKITLICPVHGKFKTTPDSHLRGGGCRKCADHQLSVNNRYTQKFFIEQSKLRHSNYYSYENTVYESSQSKVTITCPVHGDFEQLATNHMQGSGCKSCATSSALYQDIPTTLYLVKLTKHEVSRYKIGITTKPVEQRFISETRNNVDCEIIHTSQYTTGRDAFLEEQRVLKALTRFKDPIEDLLYCNSGISELLQDGNVKEYLQELSSASSGYLAVS